MSTYEYSSSYHPAAPICTVYIGPRGHDATIGPLEALIDTGADFTVIPLRYLRQAGAQVVGRSRARGLWGESRVVSIYAVALRMNGLQFRALEVIGDEDGNELVLGRLVLNRLKLILDGPAATADVVTS